MRKDFLFIPLALGALFGSFMGAHASDRPNIILIYSDDHGWADLGAQGVDPDIRTPQLDALARDGVRCSRGYVSAPQCVPSRAGVLTGRYQQRFGVEDNNRGPLPLNELTIAERLREAGYATGQVGKWHLDISGGKKAPKSARVSKDHMPHAQGFDEYFRGELSPFYASHNMKGEPFPDAPHLVSDKRFRVEVQTEAALEFLDRRAKCPEQPFFLYLAWYAPHVPLESPEPWFSKTPTHLPKERRQALAMIAAMDDGLGRVRMKLRETGQDRNTLIFFIGDNGAPLGGAWNGSRNAPLVGQKGMLTEGGIRTPFVVAWPGRLPAGAVFEKPVISLDVAATAISVAGLPSDPALDGVDLMPFLAGKNLGNPHELLFWRWGSQAAVLEHPWKLVRLGDRAQMLFDVSRPDGEQSTRDLLASKPDVAERLSMNLKRWSEGLQPPGLPTSLDSHHEGLFAEHEVIAQSGRAAKKNHAADGSVLGWICRNGSIRIQEDRLKIVPDLTDGKRARVFLAKTGLSLKGPLEVEIDVDSREAMAVEVSWRTADQPDFASSHMVRIPLPAGEGKQTAFLPAKGEVIHVRMTPIGFAEGLAIRSIVIKASQGKVDEADFGRFNSR